LREECRALAVFFVGDWVWLGYDGYDRLFLYLE